MQTGHEDVSSCPRPSCLKTCPHVFKFLCFTTCLHVPTWRWLGHGGLTPLVGHASIIEHVFDSRPRKYSKPKPKFIISPCLHGWPFWM
jgi:hypothetical protein